MTMRRRRLEDGLPGGLVCVGRSARLTLAGMTLALGMTAPCGAQDTGDVSFAASITANVARIRAGDRTGFGFIVGLGPRQLLVATALHAVDGPGGDTPEICFPHREITCATGSIVYVADAIGNLPALDLAILSVAYPEGLAWRPDVDGERAQAGTGVRSIGRGADWFVPDQPGSVSGADTESRMVRYTGLSTAEGVSGAPIVAGQGIVAMHVQSLGEIDGAQGIGIAAIRERLEEQVRVPWILVPRADCSAQEVHRRALSGRTITLRFDAGLPRVAMEAAARLGCLGAGVALEPVWEAADWPGAGITYRTGHVRLMRTLQTVLASFGRLEGRLGEPGGDIEVRIR